MESTPHIENAITREFGIELEAERQSLLRRRFLWYAATAAGLQVLFLIVWIWSQRWSEFGERPVATAVSLLASSITLGAFAWAFWYYHRHPPHLPPRLPVLTAVSGLIILTGVFTIVRGDLPRVIAEDIAGMVLPGAPRELAGTIQAHGTGSEPSASTSSSSEASPVETPNVGATTISARERAAAARRERREIAAIRASIDLLPLMVSHVLACCFLPWTPRECVRPLIPLLSFNAAMVVGYVGVLALLHQIEAIYALFGVGMLAFTPLIAAPGAGICWYRDTRFRDETTGRLLRGRYSQIKADLNQARRIHEALFPRPFRDEHFGLTYRYEPMRHIGGDYLFVARERDLVTNDEHRFGRLSLALIDVTGHGIPAALTVNRLYGELQRLFGEDPDASPADILRSLNRYVSLTLANHAVFMTAACFRMDPNTDALEFASAGHPPSHVVGPDGSIHELAATTHLLGATGHTGAFDPAMITVPFAPGDTLIACTDGAIEARPRNVPRGKMLGLARYRALIAEVNPLSNSGYAKEILRRVDEFRGGPPEDDTLIVEVTRVLTDALTKSAEQRLTEKRQELRRAGVSITSPAPAHARERSDAATPR
ncbi:MAG: serine/threonine-protein phosphatase [Phycisphaerales bacterium]|nr:MAG: serine/threonine-protein phosphatase [Phycisphaerales bacterium]